MSGSNVCECGKRITWRVAREKHQRVCPVHQGFLTNTCACGKSYRWPSFLKSHQRRCAKGRGSLGVAVASMGNPVCETKEIPLPSDESGVWKVEFKGKAPMNGEGKLLEMLHAERERVSMQLSVRVKRITDLIQEYEHANG